MVGSEYPEPPSVTETLRMTPLRTRASSTAPEPPETSTVQKSVYLDPPWVRSIAVITPSSTTASTFAPVPMLDRMNIFGGVVYPVRSW